MKHLKFCMMWAGWSKSVCGAETGETHRIGSLHPQKAMKELGITYTDATPQSMSDKWWFWNCESIPKNLPPFLTVLDLDPMKQIGMGLSKENAESIRDYK